MSLLIKNCRILDGKDLIQRNILIEGSKIKKITSQTVSADKVIDAANKLVLPGAIDTHVHVRDPGQTYKEDWRTASMAAAHGGVTAIFDMPNNLEPVTTEALLMDKLSIAENKSLVNFGCYLGISIKNLDKLNKLSKKAVGLKLYMCKTTGNLTVTDLKVQEMAFMKAAGTNKVMVVHAEDEQTNIDAASAIKDWDNPLSHAKARPAISEEKAVKVALEFAKKYNTKTNFCHISTKKALDVIKNMGSAKITCDTCHHYLFMDETDLNKKGAYAKMNPPLRAKNDQEALWKAIGDETIKLITTDHAPHTKEEKSKSFRDAPSGVPGLDTYMPLLLDAVNHNRLSLEKLQSLTAENPTRLFGLKNKGYVKEGYDADLIIVDMHLKKKVSEDELFTKCGWSPYEGRELKGWPVMTIVNGNVVFDNGEIIEDVKGKPVVN